MQMPSLAVAAQTLFSFSFFQPLLRRESKWPLLQPYSAQVKTKETLKGYHILSETNVNLRFGL